MPGPAIEVHDLIVRYRETVAVDRVSFEARAGQIVALLGPNGAGKTSTVEALEGYRRPAMGRVRVLGLDPHRDHRALTRRMGVMLQRGGVYPSMSPREAVRLFASYYDESEEPEGLLYRVGLGSVASTPWRRLSGGEQQRLSLALALVGRPWVAFLDEPTAGVDPQGRLAIREVINDLRSAGACVLLTTHEMLEAERLADRIIILDHGRIVADGTPSELMTKERGKGIRFSAPAGLDAIALGAALEAVVDEERPGEYLVHALAAPTTIAALTAWLAGKDLALTDLRVGERLEEVFLRLTTTSENAGSESALAAAPGPTPPAAVAPAAAASPAAATPAVAPAAIAPPAASAAAAGTTGQPAGATTAGGATAASSGTPDDAGSWSPGMAATGAAAQIGRRRRSVGAGGRGPGATDPLPPDDSGRGT